MKNWNFVCLMTLMVFSFVILQACGSDEGEDGDPGDSDLTSDFISVVTNQFDEVVFPTMQSYQAEITNFENTISSVASPIDEATLSSLRQSFESTYLAYQSAAVHDYFSNAVIDLVKFSNLFPIEVNTLEDLIESESRDFEGISHLRANGFPAIDYLLYGSADVADYLNGDPKRLAFLQALVLDMKGRADNLVTQWSNLRDPFISSDGTGSGSAISSQLNGSLVYYEDRVREDKVGIPIGRLGPNDSPIDSDPTKIEAYYQSLIARNENFTLSLVRATIEEMEDMYLGSTTDGTNGPGYDDLLIGIDQGSIDTDIKAQFAAIYAEIDGRSSISGNEDLYTEIQALVTVFKSDLFPVLNVQDADGANDGD